MTTGVKTMGKQEVCPCHPNQGHLSLLLLLLNNCFDLISKRRDFVGGDIPHNLIVDPEIIVDQPASHTGHRSPLNSRVTILDFLGNLLRGFTDDLQATHESPLMSLIFQKHFFGQSARLLGQVSSFVEDMSQVVKRRVGHIRLLRGCAARGEGLAIQG